MIGDIEMAAFILAVGIVFSAVILGIALPQRQRSQYRPHRLQTAAQQLIQLMAITPGKLQTQSSAHALVIRPDTAPSKYLCRLLIYAVVTLATSSHGVCPNARA